MSKYENYQHIVFRTRFSMPSIPMASRKTLLIYIHQVSKEMGVDILRMNAHFNHLHILANIPPKISISDYVQKIKGTSSKAFQGHSEFPNFTGWAKKFGSFSKSKEDTDTVINYIMNQDEHHRHHTFREELEELFGSDFFDDIYNRQEWLDEGNAV